MKIHEYIKENWRTLPKSKFDDIEVVIFREVKNNDMGYGHHSYEGYGVDKKGKYRWLFSSGCSCEGGPSEKTIKDFVVDGKDITTEKPEEIDFEELKVICNSY